MSSSCLARKPGHSPFRRTRVLKIYCNYLKIMSWEGVDVEKIWKVVSDFFVKAAESVNNLTLRKMPLKFVKSVTIKIYQEKICPFLQHEPEPDCVTTCHCSQAWKNSINTLLIATSKTSFTLNFFFELLRVRRKLVWTNGYKSSNKKILNFNFQLKIWKIATPSNKSEFGTK